MSHGQKMNVVDKIVKFKKHSKIFIRLSEKSRQIMEWRNSMSNKWGNDFVVEFFIKKE